MKLLRAPKEPAGRSFLFSRHSHCIEQPPKEWSGYI